MKIEIQIESLYSNREPGEGSSYGVQGAGRQVVLLPPGSGDTQLVGQLVVREVRDKVARFEHQHVPMLLWESIDVNMFLNFR